MKIVLAPNLGMCFGVRRALDKTEEAALKVKKVYTLGPVVHNRQVIEKLAQQGINTVESINQVTDKNSAVILRAHGVTPEIEEKAKQTGAIVVDATCPYVKKVQLAAKNFLNQGYQTVVIGDPNHPEIIGVNGWCDNKAWIVNSLEDVKNLPYCGKIGVVAQTTYSRKKWEEILIDLKEKYPEVKTANTICNATQLRQDSARKLCEKVDLVIVIGGKNSSNTNKLAQICRETGTTTYHIESVNELKPEWFKNIDSIGITAGASTPEWIIKEVTQKMMEFSEDNMTGATPGESSTPEVPVEAKEEQALPEGNADKIAEKYEETFVNLRSGDIVEGTVVQVNDSEVLVNIGYKSDGTIPLNELSNEHFDSATEVVSKGDLVKVYVLKVEDKEGNLILSKKRADLLEAWNYIEKVYEEKAIIEAEVTEEVKGGLLVNIKGLRGFIPASHVALHFVPDLKIYIGQTLRLKVIEFDRKKNRIILSQKIVLEEEQEIKKQETWNTIEDGQVLDGIVRRITDFGAFVDIGGVDGLVHISEMSWGRIKHPSEVLKEGDEIKVKVLSVDRERERISLGLKQVLPDPWENIDSTIKPGDIITGKVVKLVSFGAFVEIVTGVEGLVHISQISHQHIAKPDDVLTVGEQVEVKVLEINKAEHKISLSIKEANKQPVIEKKEERKHMEQQQEGSGVTLGDMFGDLFENHNKEE